MLPPPSWADIVLPDLVFAYLLWTGYIVYQIGALFRLISAVLWFTIAVCFLHLWKLPFSFSRFIPPQGNQSSQQPVNASNSSPDARFCNKHSCKGHLKPPGTHHCSVCKVCREGYDHHCLLVGSCITSANIKAFLLMLYCIPILVVLSFNLISPAPWPQAISAFKIARSNPDVGETWFDRTGVSFIFSGSIGRLILGVYYGYNMLGEQSEVEQVSCYMAKPLFSRFFVSIISLLLCIITAAMAWSMTDNLINGVSSVQRLRLLDSPSDVVNAHQSRNNWKDNVSRLWHKPLFNRYSYDEHIELTRKNN